MPLSGGVSRLGLDTHKINHKYNPWTIFLFQVLAQYVYFEDSLNNCQQFSCQYSLLINFKLQTTSKFWRSIYTVVLIRVGYFVLLNYSYKSWSIIKTRDRFENCWSWHFQNTPYMSNLTKFWLRYLRLKTDETNLLFSWYLICWRWK